MIKFYLFIWPFYLPFKLWNPIGKKDRRNGAPISDIPRKLRAKRFSKRERQRRLEAKEPEQKCFTCKTTRSLDLESG